MSFAAALRFEVLSLLRVRETYTFVLLPALLAVPVFVGGGAIYATFGGRTTLALPEHDPPGIDLVAALEPHYELVRSADPAEAGADVAITAWDAGPVHVARDTWFPVELPAPAWLSAEVQGSEALRTQLETKLRDAMRDQLDRAIVERGGDVDQVRRVARVGGSSTERRGLPDLPFDLRRLLVMLYVTGALYGGCFLIPVRTASERVSGVLEALAVTRTPLLTIVAARVAVSTGLIVATLALPTGITALLVDFGPFQAHSLDLVEGVCAIALGNTLYALCGVLARSVRLALYAASYLVMALVGCFATGMFVDLPYVPLLGLAHEGGQIARIGGTAALTAVTLGVFAALTRHERVLPPALGGE